MNAATKLDKEINKYLVRLNARQKKAVLTMVKTFAGKLENDLWQDEAFIAELDRRTAGYEKGKAKVLTLDELESRARKAYKSKAKPHNEYIVNMPATTYYLRIKNNYAAGIIKDLQKLDAVELLEKPPIPNWQKKEVRKRLKDVQKKNARAISWNEGTKKIKQPAT